MTLNQAIKIQVDEVLAKLHRVEPCRECGHIDNVDRHGFCDQCLRDAALTEAIWGEGF